MKRILVDNEKNILDRLRRMVHSSRDVPTHELDLHPQDADRKDLNLSDRMELEAMEFLDQFAGLRIEAMEVLRSIASDATVIERGAL